MKTEFKSDRQAMRHIGVQLAMLVAFAALSFSMGLYVMGGIVLLGMAYAVYAFISVSRVAGSEPDWVAGYVFSDEFRSPREGERFTVSRSPFARLRVATQDVADPAFILVPVAKRGTAAPEPQDG